MIIFFSFIGSLELSRTNGNFLFSDIPLHWALRSWHFSQTYSMPLLGTTLSDSFSRKNWLFSRYFIFNFEETGFFDQFKFTFKDTCSRIFESSWKIQSRNLLFQMFSRIKIAQASSNYRLCSPKALNLLWRWRKDLSFWSRQCISEQFPNCPHLDNEYPGGPRNCIFNQEINRRRDLSWDFPKWGVKFEGFDWQTPAKCFHNKFPGRINLDFFVIQ